MLRNDRDPGFPFRGTLAENPANVIAAFRDGALSATQIGKELAPLEADFARCLAMSAWATAKPLRLVVFGLPMPSSLDACLLATLRAAGHAFDSLDDARLAGCWDSRWEFVAPDDYSLARYQRGPSYRERLRVKLLLDAWRAAACRAAHRDVLDALVHKLAASTAAFAAHLAIPSDLLRRAADEHRFVAAGEKRFREQLRRMLIELGENDVRTLAIVAAFDGGDLDSTVARHGTPAMRVLSRAYSERRVPGAAREALDVRFARIRAELWAPRALFR
jgi:hypothetical protein